MSTLQFLRCSNLSLYQPKQIDHIPKTLSVLQTIKNTLGISYIEPSLEHDFSMLVKLIFKSPVPNTKPCLSEK